jgi:hypothetical protein
VISLQSFEHAMPNTASVSGLEDAIHRIRGQRVMLDSDLARFYGVPTKRLNEAFSRQRKRFPEDFAFRLRAEEVTILRSQIATSSLSHGGRRTLPWAFTEHGVIMLASVLNSTTAIAASVRVVRAFVRLREMIMAHHELAAKLGEIERRLDTHDDAIANLFSAIRQLIEPPDTKPREEIGFHVREDEPGVTTAEQTFSR